MAYFALMPDRASVSHRLGAHPSMGGNQITRRGEASGMLAFAHPLHGMSSSSMYCDTVPSSMDGRGKSGFFVSKATGRLPFGVDERRTRTGLDVFTGQSRSRRTVVVDERRTRNVSEPFAMHSDRTVAVDGRRTRNLSAIGRHRQISPLFSEERNTSSEMTGNLCPIPQPLAQTFGRKRKPESVLTQPKKLSTPQPSAQTFGLKRKHESVLAPSTKLSTLKRQNTAEVSCNIEWEGRFNQESMGCSINQYGSMEGRLELDEAGSILGLKSPLSSNRRDTPVFSSLVDSGLIRERLGTNLTSHIKSPVASHHRASPVPDANQVMGLDTHLQASMDGDGALKIGEVGKSPGLKSPVTHDKTLPFLDALADFGNCFKQEGLGIELIYGPSDNGLYNSNSNRVYPPCREAPFASPFLDCSKDECRLEDLGLNINPYGSMSPCLKSAEEERVDAAGQRQENFEAFLRFKVEKNEEEIACMQEENLTLHEKLTRLESERKDLECSHQLWRTSSQEVDSCDGFVGYLPSPCASQSEYSLS